MYGVTFVMRVGYACVYECVVFVIVIVVVYVFVCVCVYTCRLGSCLRLRLFMCMLL